MSPAVAAVDKEADLQATPAPTAPTSLPVSEKGVYARAGLLHGSVPDMFGDTFISFKSFLAAATASGVVCEVRDGILGLCLTSFRGVRWCVS